jgi:hypothetical protein
MWNFKRSLVSLSVLLMLGAIVGQTVNAQFAPEPARAVDSPITSAPAADCFPGTGETSTPPGPGTSPYPPRAYLPLVAVEICTLEREPNNAYSTAQTLMTNCFAGQIQSTPNFVDVDWYRLHLCSPIGTATIHLQGEGALALNLYANPNSAPIASGQPLGTNSALTATALLSGTYYVRVSPVVVSDTGDTTSYTVEAEVK